jgi:hypothetical protein
LIDAARSGNPEVVKEILLYNPNLERRDYEGKTLIVLQFFNGSFHTFLRTG